VDLAFALTFHKIQGKTVDKIILDLNKRPGTRHKMNSLDFFALYVGISRVRDPENMRILPPHNGAGDLNYIKRLKCDPRLRRWLRGYNRDKTHWELVEE
jgi:hypothetical protein